MFFYTVFTFPQDTRKQKLDRLCSLTSRYNATEIAHSNLFEARRNVHRLTGFEQERLETALELRSADIKSCCGLVRFSFLHFYIFSYSIINDALGRAFFLCQCRFITENMLVRTKACDRVFDKVTVISFMTNVLLACSGNIL